MLQKAVAYLGVSCVQRSKGSSIHAKAAYDSCGVLYSDYYEKKFDYTKKSGLVFSSVVVPDGHEEISLQTLCDNAEKQEKRRDACTGRSIVAALPLSLNQEQRTELTKDFSKRIADRYNVCLAINIHEPIIRKYGADKNAENPHFHLLFSDRDINGNKLRMFARNPNEIVEIRKLWENVCNEHFDKAGLSEIRMDMSKQKPVDINADIKKLSQEISEMEQEEARLDTKLKDLQARLAYVEKNLLEQPVQL